MLAPVVLKKFYKKYFDIFHRLTIPFFRAKASEEPLKVKLAHAPARQTTGTSPEHLLDKDNMMETTEWHPMHGVIRYLADRFRLGLVAEPDQMAYLQQVTDAFDPRTPMIPDAVHLLRHELKRMVKGAADLEGAYAFLDTLGLRKKLIGLGDATDSADPSWLLSQEPLPRDPSPEAHPEGHRTYAECGLPLTVYHSTSTNSDYEMMVQGHDARLNAFQTSQMMPGLLGQGFYTKLAAEPKKGEVPVEIEVDPTAVEGVDFVHTNLMGPMVVWLTSRKLKVVSLSYAEVENWIARAPTACATAMGFLKGGP